MKSNFKEHFTTITTFILNELFENEQASISYDAENSDFLRFNNGKVRQNGAVIQSRITVKLWKAKRTHSFTLQLQGETSLDIKALAIKLEQARLTIGLLPEDPYQAIPTAENTSNVIYKGKLISANQIVSTILDPVQGLDFTGIFSQGALCRGVVNSMGANHWFETETFLVDYSVWLENGRAIKGSYAGREWNSKEYTKKIAEAREGLAILQKPQKKIEPGKYRMFITADALVEINSFFSWNGFSEKSIQQGESAYLALKEGRETFSEKFTLSQDFSLGLQPTFNANGEMAPEKLEIVFKGKLKNTLISARSAKQYGGISNGAEEEENMKSIVIEKGSMAEAEALKKLGTGIYISNFHYLNWSDPISARITGMTRFACLWVENGKVVAPIADMRWDESLYNIFGANLLEITKERHLFADDSTYEQRSVGGCYLPGILVKDFNCTL